MGRRSLQAEKHIYRHMLVITEGKTNLKVCTILCIYNLNMYFVKKCGSKPYYCIVINIIISFHEYWYAGLKIRGCWEPSASLSCPGAPSYFCREPKDVLVSFIHSTF